jgi:1,4-dihydroxy-2-naphthoyl-CoA hydrolase
MTASDPQSGEPTPDHVAYLAKLGNGALADRMGIEIISVSAERVVGRMPVAGNTQPFGLLHGGATASWPNNSDLSALWSTPARNATPSESSCP